MVRGLFVLILCAGLVHAQDKDDEGITVDEPPPAEEPGAAPERTTAFPARAAGKKVPTVPIRKKVYSFVLPADWVLHAADDPKTELGWDVLLPGSTTRASLYLLREENIADPRCAPYYQAEWYRKERPDEKPEVRIKPCPRLVVRRSLNATDWVDANFYLSVRNNPYLFQLSCSAADFAQAEVDVLAAVQSFSAKVEIWPPIPKGYTTSEEGIWLVAHAPSVTASLAPIVKGLKDQEKRFRRDHGPLPKSDAPIVVLVTASQDEAAKIEPNAAKDTNGFYADAQHRRMFAVPFGKGSLEQDGLLAADAQAMLFVARYGDARPDWVWAGEQMVARAEAYTDKPLPVLDEGFANLASKLSLHTVDGLEALYKADPDAWSAECLFYVGMFHAGKYKKAYDAFLEEYAATGDGEGAAARHLVPVGLEELRTATHDFVFGKIKTQKREQK